MQLNNLYISLLLITANLSAAQTGPDSLQMKTISSIRKPEIYSIVIIDDNSDAPEGITRYYPHNGNHHTAISPHARMFYKNLRETARQRNITRWIHELIIRDPATSMTALLLMQQGESRFIPFEGMTVHQIRFVKSELFAPDIGYPQDYSSGTIEKAGLFFHYGTRESVLRKNLLFREGDIIDPLLLADNERILRQLSHIRDAYIYVFRESGNPELANIVVVTKDRWSRGFDMDLSDIERGRLELFDRNVLGYGQELQGNLLFDGGRDKMFGFGAEVNINNLSGSFINTNISFLDAFDNNVIHLRGEREFLTPAMKYAGGAEFISAGITDDFYYNDTSFLMQKLSFRKYDYWFGRSFLLPVQHHYKRNNIYITSRFSRDIFYDRPGTGESIRYEFHNKNIFLLGLAFRRLGYLKSSYIYGFGPTEDIPVGTGFETVTGYEDNQYFRRWYAGISLTNSYYIDNLAYLNHTVSIGGFINDGGSQQGIFTFKSSGFTTLIDLHRFFMRQFLSIDFTRGYRRFEDERLSISNRNGIRGLRSDMLSGNQKLLLQTETLFYAKSDWYGFRYAIYLMADLGWVGPGGRTVTKDYFYSGFGLGMRVRNEHLVFPTLNFRFAFFPRIPESASTRLFYIISESKNILDEFNVSAPSVIPFR